MNPLGWITRLLGGGLADKLLRAYEARENAKSEADRLAAESTIRALEIAQANRLATSDNMGVKVAVGLAAVGVCGHLAAVCFVSAFPMFGWTVHALPAPMNDWQREIVLGLFGLAGVGAVAKVFRR